MNTYRKDRVVEIGDLDHLKHVNNVRYLDWVQEISGEHWDELARPDWKSTYRWVVRSHQITYHRPALLGQVLQLSTYVPETRGPMSIRQVDIRLKESGEKIAECRTEWVLLDAARGRPVRIPEAMQRVFG